MDLPPSEIPPKIAKSRKKIPQQPFEGLFTRTPRPLLSAAPVAPSAPAPPDEALLTPATSSNTAADDHVSSSGPPDAVDASDFLRDSASPPPHHTTSTASNTAPQAMTHGHDEFVPMSVPATPRSVPSSTSVAPTATLHGTRDRDDVSGGFHSPMAPYGSHFPPHPGGYVYSTPVYGYVTPVQAHRTPAYAQPPAPAPAPRRQYIWENQKLDLVLDLLHKLKLTIGDLLYLLFRLYEPDGRTKVSRSERHRLAVGHFLSGTTTWKLGHILELIYAHPSGQPDSTHEERRTMFKQTPVFTKISHARPALSCFAAQICADRISRDAARAVKPQAGLHAHVHVPRDVQRSSSSTKKPLVTRQDIGRNVVQTVHTVIARECELLYSLCLRAATKPRNQLTTLRVTRPAETVITGTISSLLFTRTRSANLLPLAQSLAFFAARAEMSLYRIGSRFGTSVAYTTAYRAMIALADSQKDDIRRVAASRLTCCGLVLDNAQHYFLQHEMRAGRADIMIKGLVGTQFVINGDPESLHLDNFVPAHRAGAGLNLTWEQIESRIDYQHLDLTAELHWLQVLILSFPALSVYHTDVQRAFRTEAVKFQLPVERTTIHPLRSNAHDPALATGLKDGVYDFVGNQMGQDKEHWTPRLILVGGDGGTFEGLVRIQRYMQVSPDAHSRMNWMVPILHLFHLEWTVASRIANECWGVGSERSMDISMLGHNANAVQRKTPSNLKKINFASDTETLFIIGEARMRDCWREIFAVDDLNIHLEGLKTRGQLPTFEELRVLARRLHRTYSCERGYQQALKPYSKQSTSNRAPLGKNSTPETATDSPEIHPELAGLGGHTEATGFEGDRNLANSIKFLHHFVELREWFRSISEGDIGSTWECMKAEIKRLAGSGHNPNYLNYVLMMFCIIELYASPSLRETIFKGWLVNMAGQPGHFKACDLLQENHINRLDRHLQHKDRQYDEPFIRDIVSPNLDLLNEIPRQMEEAVSLQPRKTHHRSPHTRVETATLAEMYRQAELHRFCSGRSSGFLVKNQDEIGLRRLQDPKDALKKFREFHGNMNVLGSAPTQPLIRIPGQHSAPEPTRTSALASGASENGNDSEEEGSSAPEPGDSSDTRNDGLSEGLYINDRSEEIEGVHVTQRVALFVEDGQLASETQEESQPVEETKVDESPSDAEEIPDSELESEEET